MPPVSRWVLPDAATRDTTDLSAALRIGPLAAQVLSGAGRVLDFGCGSGIGSAELRCHFQDVTAVDSDPGAIEFAGA